MRLAQGPHHLARGPRKPGSAGDGAVSGDLATRDFHNCLSDARKHDRNSNLLRPSFQCYANGKWQFERLPMNRKTKRTRIKPAIENRNFRACGSSAEPTATLTVN